MSETQACSLAAAFWEEFGGLDGADDKPSADFLRVASRLSKTGHGYLLSSHLKSTNLQLTSRSLTKM